MVLMVGDVKVQGSSFDEVSNIQDNHRVNGSQRWLPLVGSPNLALLKNENRKVAELMALTEEVDLTLGRAYVFLAL